MGDSDLHQVAFIMSEDSHGTNSNVDTDFQGQDTVPLGSCSSAADLEQFVIEVNFTPPIEKMQAVPSRQEIVCQRRDHPLTIMLSASSRAHYNYSLDLPTSSSLPLSFHLRNLLLPSMAEHPEGNIF